MQNPCKCRLFFTFKTAIEAFRKYLMMQAIFVGICCNLCKQGVLYHRSGIEPDVSLSKIYVRDFEELASAFVRFARVRFARVRFARVRFARVRLARVRSLASNLLAWRESFLLKRSSVSFISKIRQENKDQ